MKQEQEQMTFDLERCGELLKHPKDKVRKWASEQVMAFGGESGRPALLPLIHEPLDEMAVPVIDYLSGANFQQGAEEILELFKTAGKAKPVRSIRASWCAQGLGKLNHQPALPHFADYIKRNPGDVGLLGICSALGDIDGQEAREMLRGVITGLEKTGDSGVPYLGDVVVDALLRHTHLGDVGVVLRLQQAWQNEGHKNPRTYSSLARVMGENEVYPQMESATLRKNDSIVSAVKEQEELLGVNLQEMTGQLVYRGLLNGMEKGQPDEIITWSRQAVEEMLLNRYGGLDQLRGDEMGEAPSYERRAVPALQRDRLSLRVLDGLNDPRYRSHHSKMDPLTQKRQALLALSGLLEVAARRDYPQMLKQAESLDQVIDLLLSRRWHIPGAVLERAADMLGQNPDGPMIERLIGEIGSTGKGYGKMRAAGLIGRLRHAPAVKALIGGLESEHQWMREACREALVSIGTPVLDYLEENPKDIPEGSWGGVADVLCRLPYQRSAEIAYRAWQDPLIPKMDGLIMVHEKVGSPDSIAFLWDIYQESPKLVGESLELLCDVYEMEFPELAEVREANRIEAEEQRDYQQGIWKEIRGEAPKENYEMILNPDQPKKPAPAQSDRPGRNDVCPCGSGKKFKKCCGR